MDKIERIKEIVRSMLKRDELPKDPLTPPPEERSLRFFLSLLFKPEALPQDPVKLKGRGKGVFGTIFERESLPQEELPRDSFIPTQEEGAPGMSFLSLLFKPDALPQDPAIVQEREKGAFRTLFVRESLPHEETPEDLFIPTQEEGAPAGSFFSLMFKPDALSKDPTPLKKKKGLFRIVFDREPLPEDIEES